MDGVVNSGGVASGVQSIRLSPDGPDFPAEAGDTLLGAALRAGVGLPYECASGGCGSCKVEVLAGSVEDLRPDAPGLSLRDRARGRYLACQSRALGDCRLAFREDPAYRPKIRPQRFRARLQVVEALTHDFAEFRFVSDAPASFLPGQYALLQLPGVEGKRAYSMSNLANAQGLWEFQIKRVPGGKATTHLFEACTAGSEVELDAPYSISHLNEAAPRDIVCIAGGSGLAPMLSIARGFAGSESLAGRQLYLFYGGREPADIVDPARFALPYLGGRIRFLPAISEGRSEEAAGWSGGRGFIHHYAAEMLGQDFQRFEYYIAGPPPMVEAVRRLLIIEKSVPTTQVHYDRFF